MNQWDFLRDMPFFHGWAQQTVAALHAIMRRKPQRSRYPSDGGRRR
jgi:hypothetical protein